MAWDTCENQHSHVKWGWVNAMGLSFPSEGWELMNRYFSLLSLMNHVLLLSPFYRWTNWGTKILSDLIKVTQLVSDKAVRLQSVILTTLLHSCFFISKAVLDSLYYFTNSRNGRIWGNVTLCNVNSLCKCLRRNAALLSPYSCGKEISEITPKKQTNDELLDRQLPRTVISIIKNSLHIRTVSYLSLNHTFQKHKCVHTYLCAHVCSHIHTHALNMTPLFFST